MYNKLVDGKYNKYVVTYNFKPGFVAFVEGVIWHPYMLSTRNGSVQ